MRNKNTQDRTISTVLIMEGVLIGIPFIAVFVWDAPITWTTIGWYALAVIVLGLALPAAIGSILAKMEPRHTPIVGTDSWESPLTPQDAVREIGQIFKDERAQVIPRGDSLEVIAGSDARFRFWGVYTKRGKSAIPVKVTFQAKKEGSGSLISAEARDGLGRYVGQIGNKVQSEIENRISSLIERAKRASAR